MLYWHSSWGGSEAERLLAPVLQVRFGRGEGEVGAELGGRERGKLEPNLEGGKEGGIGREVEMMCEFLCFLGTVSMAPLPILKRWR